MRGGSNEPSLSGMSELNDAWAELERANVPLGWTVFRPSFQKERREWVLWAFDPREHPAPGAKRWRERLVSVPVELGELGAVREMARVLQQVNC